MGKGRDKITQRLFDKSGCKMSTDKIVLFLYLLMRDFIPVGTVGTIMKEIDNLTCEYDNPVDFTNGYLAEYAEFCAGELKKKRGDNA